MLARGHTLAHVQRHFVHNFEFAPAEITEPLTIRERERERRQTEKKKVYGPISLVHAKP